MSTQTTHKLDGFTLIEVVIVLVILSIVALPGARILSRDFSAYFHARDISDTVWQGRVALERASRELRAAVSTSLSATSISITFQNTDGETVTIDRDTGNNQLRLDVDSDQQILADNVTSLAFSYLDEDANTTTTNSDIRAITPEIGITKNETTLTLRTTVEPRNIP